MSPHLTLSARAGSRHWARKKRYRILAALLLLLTFVYVTNSSWLAGTPDGSVGLLAHRGVAQTFDLDGIDADTCTAERIHEPTHSLLENTITSMRAAFDAGADQVEFDVHVTADDQFAVFHDWEVDCRTDGTGQTRDLTMQQLRELDIGYGYTADGGKTFPFRGKGVGLMPSLDEVLEEFDTQRLLIHVKSNDPAEGKLLAEHLAPHGDRLSTITVYGGDEPVEQLRTLLPQLRVMSKATMTDCLVQYELYGWLGIVPGACENTQLHVPEGYAPYLWGWPVKFVDRMASVDTTVVLVAGDGDWAEGFDSTEALERVPDGFTGMIWTNKVADVSPAAN